MNNDYSKVIDLIEKTIDNTVEGLSHGFYNKACQNGVRLVCHVNANFWVDELNKMSRDDVDFVVKNTNKTLPRGTFLEYRYTGEIPMLTVSFTLDSDI